MKTHQDARKIDTFSIWFSILVSLIIGGAILNKIGVSIADLLTMARAWVGL